MAASLDKGSLPVTVQSGETLYSVAPDGSLTAQEQLQQPPTWSESNYRKDGHLAVLCKPTVDAGHCVLVFCAAKRACEGVARRVLSTPQDRAAAWKGLSAKRASHAMQRHVHTTVCCGGWQSGTRSSCMRFTGNAQVVILTTTACIVHTLSAFASMADAVLCATVVQVRPCAFTCGPFAHKQQRSLLLLLRQMLQQRHGLQRGGVGAPKCAK